MFRSVIVRLALWSFDHARLYFFLLFALLGLTVWAMQGLQVDMSNEGTLKKSNPVRITYNQFREQFGRDDYVLVLVDVAQQKSRGTGFADTFAALARLQSRLEAEVPYVDEINSLADVRYTYSRNDTLHVDKLLPLYQSGYWDNDQAFLDFASQHPLYKNRFISEDGRYIALAVRFKSQVPAAGADSTAQDSAQAAEHGADGSPAGSDSMTDMMAMMDAAGMADMDTGAVIQAVELKKVDSLKMAEALQKLKSVVQASQLAVHITGAPYISDELSRITTIGSAKTGTIAMVITFCLLLGFFGRMSAVWIPLAVVPLSIVFPLGLKALAGMPYTLYSGIVAPLMIAIGVAGSVHIMSRFFEKYDATGSKRKAVEYAMRHTGLTVLLTSITTALGFISFATGDLEAIANLGIYAAASVMTAFFLSIMFIPACFALFRIRQRDPQAHTPGVIEAIISGMMRFSVRHSKVIVALSLLAVAGLAYNTQHMVIRYNIADDLNPGVVKSDYHTVNTVLKSVNPVEIVVDTEAENGALRLPLMQALAAAEAEIAEQQLHGVYVSRPYSLTSIVKEVNMALQDNQPAAYTLPDSEDTIAQELSLFESSARDDLFEAVDERFQTLRVSVQVSDADSGRYQVLLQHIQSVFDRHLAGMATATITGDTALAADVLAKISSTMTRSYAVSFITITLLLMLLIRSFRLGLLSIVPNVLPILIVINILIALGWPLDLTTVMLGVIAIGIVVDDTLHILHHYREQRATGASIEQSFVKIVPTTGKALLTTTTLFACANFNNVFSPIPGFITFGVALSAVTVLALVADLLVLPAMIAAFTKDPEPQRSVSV